MSIFDTLFGSEKQEQDLTTTQQVEPKTASSVRKDRNTNACPSCGVVFEKPPKRMTKCAECKATSYVRTKQLIFNSDLLTEEQMLASDFYDDLINHGAKVEDYARMEEALKLKWHKTKINPYDVVWSVSNQLMTRLPAHTSSPDELLQAAKMLMFSSAKYQALRGNDPSGYLAGVNDYDRQLAVLHGAKEFKIETNGCCDVCSKQQGKKYSAEYLTEHKVLPIEGCTYKFDKRLKHSWCLCWLYPIYDFDLS